MRELIDFILGNPAFNVAFLSWFTAQVIKVAIGFATDKKVSFKHFMDSGGMPSSHSAFVVALAFSIASIDGFASTQFALSLGFACIVMYDAAGVRRAAGEQAKILNKIMDTWENQEPNFIRMELKELLGHTPIQVAAGAALGLLLSFLIMWR